MITPKVILEYQYHTGTDATTYTIIVNEYLVNVTFLLLVPAPDKVLSTCILKER